MPVKEALQITRTVLERCGGDLPRAQEWFKVWTGLLDVEPIDQRRAFLSNLYSVYCSHGEQFVANLGEGAAMMWVASLRPFRACCRRLPLSSRQPSCD